MCNCNEASRIEALEAENKRLKANNNNLRMDIIRLEKQLQGRFDIEEQPKHIRDAMVMAEHLRGHIEVVESKHRQALTSTIDVKNDRNKWRAECLVLRQQLATTSTPAPTLNQHFGAGSSSSHTYHQQNITNNIYVTNSSGQDPPNPPSSGATARLLLPLRPAADNAPTSDVTAMDTDGDMEIDTKAPIYGDSCKREAKALPCEHQRCKYFHEYQTKRFGHLRHTLPKQSEQ